MTYQSYIIIRLLQLPRIGPKTANKIATKILAQYMFNGYDDDLLVDEIESYRSDIQIPALTKDDYKFAFDKADTIMRESEKRDIRFVSIFDHQYPSNLKNLKNPPIILNYIGDIEVFKNK